MGSLSKVLAVHSQCSVLVCGDDLTDEDMFKELSAQGARAAGCCESILVCPPLEEGGDVGTVRATAATCFVSSVSVGGGASPLRRASSLPPLSSRARAPLTHSLARTHAPPTDPAARRAGAAAGGLRASARKDWQHPLGGFSAPLLHLYTSK